MVLSCRYNVVLESEHQDDAVLVEDNKDDAESAIAEVGKEGTSTKDHEDLDSEDDLPVMVCSFAALSTISLVVLKSFFWF